MITVVSGTNRKNSECLNFARTYVNILERKTSEPIRLLALEDIPHDWFHSDMYEEAAQSPSLTALQDEYILAANKFVFVMPEYNGSFPGSLKLFIDALSIRKYKGNFSGKIAALVGIASGRAGNLRGMDHLASVLNHMGTIVLPFQLPISRIRKLIDQDEIVDRATLEVLEKQADQLLAFSTGEYVH